MSVVSILTVMIIDSVCHSRQHEMLSLCCRRQAHEKEKKYKVDNNIKPICLYK